VPCIIYSNSKSKAIIDFVTADAVKYYIRHYENWLFLCEVFAGAPDKEQRRQANYEIRIAQRKMDFWMRHRNMNVEEAARQMSAIRIGRRNLNIGD